MTECDKKNTEMFPSPWPGCSVIVGRTFEQVISAEQLVSELSLLDEGVVDVDGVVEADQRGQGRQDAPEDEELAAGATLEESLYGHVIQLPSWNSQVRRNEHDWVNSSFAGFNVDVVAHIGPL